VTGSTAKSEPSVFPLSELTLIMIYHSQNHNAAINAPMLSHSFSIYEMTIGTENTASTWSYMHTYTEPRSTEVALLFLYFV
jgi:hypothetical protein